MPVPPVEPRHIETRLLVVAEMLEKAVSELRHTITSIQDESPTPDQTPTDPTGSSDAAQP